ncbi:unnamed protein product [Rotaria magnacalcarata]|uniref:Tetratricopeptide repeat protein 29 n=2 Tax=Rotaria magnacalcarata TaxID=392030 RepID=A0A816TXC4_9BILA|nr:unnamed protein product [Rotaria magnacalcarata]
MGTSIMEHTSSDIDQLYSSITRLFPSEQLVKLAYNKAMGSKHFKEKNFKASIDCFENGLTIQKQSSSSDNRITASLFCSIAESHFQLKNHDQAIEFYRKAMELNTVLPEEGITAHLYMGYAYLARACRTDFDDLSLAEQHLRRAMEIHVDYDILGDKKVVELYEALADIDYHHGAFEEAISFLTEALQICEDNEWTDDTNRFNEKIQEIELNRNEKVICDQSKKVEHNEASSDLI